MDVIRCEKGHFYDASQYATCPQCAKEASGAAGGFGGDFGLGDVGRTMPVNAPMPGLAAWTTSAKPSPLEPMYPEVLLQCRVFRMYP